jgi:hypothetical protein
MPAFKFSSYLSQRIIRYTLGSLLTFAGLNALGGGYYGMSGAEKVPLKWLEGSPFNNYFMPGLILFVVVGGSFLFASIAVFACFRFARFASFASVIVVFVWLAVQFTIIGYVSWMQPVTAIVALVILFLTWLLHQLPDVSH